MKNSSTRELLRKKIVENLPVLSDVHMETIVLDRPFENIAAAFAQDLGTVLLLSGSNLDSSRYNILAVKPWLGIKSQNNAVSIKYGGKEFYTQQDPFSAIQALLNRFEFNHDNFDFPVLSGLFGYFAYDLKDLIEKLPSTCKETGLPDLCLYAPLIVLVQDKNSDKQTGQATLCISILSDELESNTKSEIINQNKKFFYDRL
ncbi:MAG: aminodeoxychorismate synthase, component I, partial [Desulfobacula sp.]|nr:aminodeoxychorismate synthase, component I [Desulfobacula sp.]